MPKTPIRERFALYSRLRDKSIRLLHWNRVTTTQLGTMYETRNLVPLDNSKTTNMDIYDNGFTDFKETSDAEFLGLHGGQQVPGDFNTQ